MFFDDTLRGAPHTLSTSEETIVARTGLMAQTGQTVYSAFTSAEMPYPEITLSSGEKVRLDGAAYTQYRALPSKVDRDAVFKAFFTRYGEFGGTLATTLNAQVQAQVFTKDVRKFPSTLEAALFTYNIPTSVYDAADHGRAREPADAAPIPQAAAEDHGPAAARLRGPVRAHRRRTCELQFTPEEAKKLTLDSFAPLGPAYVDALRKGYDSGWVDFLPSTGKSSGAYSTMIYGVHPYQLLNFTGTWEEVSTLAHESGHSMHSYLAAASQPFATADYSIFVAEVASTLNENLLFHHVLDQTKDDATRLFLLSSYLDTMRTTLFRQTMFAEFELMINQAVERGEPLTKESLDAMYLKLRSPVLRLGAGHREDRRHLCVGVGLHPAFLPQLLRLPVRDQHDRRHDARRRHHRQAGRRVGQRCEGPGRIPQAPLLGVVAVPDRPAQGGWRGHDDLEAVRGRDT